MTTDATINRTRLSAPPVFEAARLTVSIRFSLLSRQTLRDYGGHAIGRRRKLTVVPFIAKDMAQQLVRGLRFSTASGSAGIDEVAATIRTALSAFPEESAFRLVDGDHDSRDAAQEDLCRNICEALLEAFDVEQIEERHPTGAAPSQENNGWLEWERIGRDAKPRYRWRRTWPDKLDDDFAGFDGSIAVGRIFRIDHIQQRQKWFWLLGYLHRPDGTPLSRTTPISGWEDTPRQAACRVEQCYDKTLKVNRTRGTP